MNWLIYDPTTTPEAQHHATSASRQPHQPAPTYREPAVYDLGSLEKLQGGYCGPQYDGPARWLFNGF
jgi:hypothetical protein